MVPAQVLILAGAIVAVTSLNDVSNDDLIAFDGGDETELIDAGDSLWPGGAISEPQVVELTLSSPWARLVPSARRRRAPQEDDDDGGQPKRRRKSRRRGGGRRRGGKRRRKGRRTSTTAPTTQATTTTPMTTTPAPTTTQAPRRRGGRRRRPTTPRAPYIPTTPAPPPPPLVPDYNVVPTGTVNKRPVIGVLSQGIPRKLNNLVPDEDFGGYIAASYVKLLESAGARVVPVMVDQSDHYYREMYRYLNGLLLPGGEADLDDSGYAHAVKTVWKVAANHPKDHFPVLGISLGMEMIANVEGQGAFLTCDAENLAAAVDVAPGSRLLSGVSDALRQSLSSEDSTVNYHRSCLTPGAFRRGALNKNFRSLGTSRDTNGREFVAGIEHKSLPVYGLQFHPEMPVFEWARTDSRSSIPRSPTAVNLAHHIAHFFVTEARLSRHRFPSPELEEDYLIYNYEPEYTSALGADFTACYFFS